MLNSKKLIAILFALTPAVGTLFAGPAEHCPVLCPISPIHNNNSNSQSFHLDIGLLYQQPSFSNMIAAIKNTEILDTTIDSINYINDSTTNMHQCFNYAVGLSASLGYTMPHDDWYMGAKFDYLNANASKSYNVSDNDSIHFSLFYPWLGNHYQEGQSEALSDLDYDYNSVAFSAKFTLYALDILLSRGSFHSNFFSYEPFTGVKALWFSTYNKSEFSLDTESDGKNGYLSTKQNNWGVGPMFGFNGEYEITKYISLFSDSDIALLFGEAHQSSPVFYQQYDGDDLDDQYESTLYNNDNCIVYVPVRSILGLKLSTYLFHEKQYVSIKVGYDARAVFSMQETNRGFNMSGLYTDLIWNF